VELTSKFPLRSDYGSVAAAGVFRERLNIFNLLNVS
jgi:hypothetical protein